MNQEVQPPVFPDVPPPRVSAPRGRGRQIADYYGKLIESGRIVDDEMLPSRAHIAVVFGVTERIAQQALEILRNDGRAYAVRGTGTRAIAPSARCDDAC